MEETIPKGKSKINIGRCTFIIDDRYECISLLGMTYFGGSISALDRKTNTKVHVQNILADHQNEWKEILKLIKILGLFNHENIMNLLDMQIYPENRDFKSLYIISDLMPTDLHSVIRSNVELTGDHVKYFIYQLLRGLLYLHSANIIHCDLKPANILINENCDLKICGFWNAKSHGRRKREDECIAARWYRSPELMLDCELITQKIDIWSCGCIFAELLSRKPLFYNRGSLDYMEVVTKLLGTPSQDDLIFLDNHDYFIYFSSLSNKEKVSWSKIYPKADPLALDLLDKMIVINPEKRWAAEHCLAHPYFQELHDINDEPLAREEFNWNFENRELSIGAIKSLVYEEAVKFHQ